MLFIKQRTLLAGTAARRTCLLSLTATVTAAEAEAAHTTHTMARGHQARRHDATARGHEDNDLVSQGIAYASSPHRLVPPSVVHRSFASLRVRRRFVSPRIASQCFGFFSTQRFGERQCDGVAAAVAVAALGCCRYYFWEQFLACLRCARAICTLLTLAALSPSTLAAEAAAALCGALGHS